MKLHLPSQLRSSLLACLCSVATVGTTLCAGSLVFSAFSGVAMAGELVDGVYQVAETETINADNKETFSGYSKIEVGAEEKLIIQTSGDYITTNNITLSGGGTLEVKNTWGNRGNQAQRGSITLNGGDNKLILDDGGGSGMTTYLTGITGSGNLAISGNSSNADGFLISTITHTGNVTLDNGARLGGEWGSGGTNAVMKVANTGDVSVTQGATVALHKASIENSANLTISGTLNIGTDSTIANKGITTVEKGASISIGTTGSMTVNSGSVLNSTITNAGTITLGNVSVTDASGLTRKEVARTEAGNGYGQTYVYLVQGASGSTLQKGDSFTLTLSDTSHVLLNEQGGVIVNQDTTNNSLYYIQESTYSYCVKEGSVNYSSLADKESIKTFFISGTQDATSTLVFGNNENFEGTLLSLNGYATVNTTASIGKEGNAALGHVTVSGVSNTIIGKNTSIRGSIDGTGDLVLKKDGDALWLWNTVSNIGDLTLDGAIELQGSQGVRLNNSGVLSLTNGMVVEGNRIGDNVTAINIGNNSTLSYKSGQVIGANTAELNVGSGGTLVFDNNNYNGSVVLDGGTLSLWKANIGGTLTLGKDGADGNGSVQTYGNPGYGSNVALSSKLTGKGDLILDGDGSSTLYVLSSDTGTLEGDITLKHGVKIGNNADGIVGKAELKNKGDITVDTGAIVDVRNGSTLANTSTTTPDGQTVGGNLYVKGALTISDGRILSDKTIVESGATLTAAQGYSQDKFSAICGELVVRGNLQTTGNALGYWNTNNTQTAGLVSMDLDGGTWTINGTKVILCQTYTTLNGGTILMNTENGVHFDPNNQASFISESTAQSQSVIESGNDNAGNQLGLYKGDLIFDIADSTAINATDASKADVVVKVGVIKDKVGQGISVGQAGNAEAGKFVKRGDGILEMTQGFHDNDGEKVNADVESGTLRLSGSAKLDAGTVQVKGGSLDIRTDAALASSATIKAMDGEATVATISGKDGGDASYSGVAVTNAGLTGGSVANAEVTVSEDFSISGVMATNSNFTVNAGLTLDSVAGFTNSTLNIGSTGSIMGDGSLVLSGEGHTLTMLVSTDNVASELVEGKKHTTISSTQLCGLGEDSDATIVLTLQSSQGASLESLIGKDSDVLEITFVTPNGASLFGLDNEVSAFSLPSGLTFKLSAETQQALAGLGYSVGNVVQSASGLMISATPADAPGAVPEPTTVTLSLLALAALAARRRRQD